MALKRLERYRELAPFDPHYGFFETVYPIAYMIEGEYEQVVSVGRRVIMCLQRINRHWNQADG